MYFTAVTAYLHHVHSSRCLKVLTYVELTTQGHFFCCDQDVICAPNIKYNYVNESLKLIPRDVISLNFNIRYFLFPA